MQCFNKFSLNVYFSIYTKCFFVILRRLKLIIADKTLFSNENLFSSYLNKPGVNLSSNEWFLSYSKIIGAFLRSMV